MEEKQREQKRARTTRSDYLSDVDEVQAWVRQAEVKVQDRSAEPQAMRDALRQVQNELGSITDKLERLTRNGRLIVENTRDDGEKELIEKTINDLTEQLAQVKSWLEEKKQVVGDTLDAWQRFLTLYEAVKAWTDEKRQFLVEPLKLSTLVQARQRLHEYSTAVKSCKQVNKNLSDMAKELDNIRQATSAGHLPEKFAEAEEAKIQIEGQLLERNALLQETSEEWEQCERKMKEVKGWIEKAKQMLESPQNKKKALRDQHAIREKMLSDVAIQKTKISISVEKLQVHFKSGIGGDKRVTEIADELMSELDALYKLVKEETSSLEVCLAQIDQYQQEIQKLRQKVVQVEQQLRTVLSPTYLPNNREKAFQEQQNLQQRMDDWRQQMRILTNQIHAVDPYYRPSNEIKDAADSPGRFTGQASYADIAAGRTSPASRGCSPYRNQQKEEAPPPPSTSSTASCPLAIEILRQTVLQERQEDQQQQISHFQRIQRPTQVEQPRKDEVTDTTSVKELKIKVKQELVELSNVQETTNSSDLRDSQLRVVVQTRRGRSPTRRLESTNRNLPAVRVEEIDSDSSPSRVPRRTEKLEFKLESAKDTLRLNKDDKRGRSASPIWVPGSTSYADVLRGGSRGLPTTATTQVTQIVNKSRSASPVDESIQSNDSANLPESSTDLNTFDTTAQDVHNEQVEEVAEEKQVKIAPNNVLFVQQSHTVIMDTSDNQQFSKGTSTNWSDEVMKESYENAENTQDIEETRGSYNYIHPPAMSELVGFIGSQLRAYPVGSYVYTSVNHHHHQQQISIGPYPSPQIAYSNHFVNQSDYLQSSNSVSQGTCVEEEAQNIGEIENSCTLVVDSHPTVTGPSFSNQSERQTAAEYVEQVEEPKDLIASQNNLETNKSQVFSYAQILSQGLNPRTEVTVVAVEKTQSEQLRDRSHSPKILAKERDSQKVTQEQDIGEKVQKVQSSQVRKSKESNWGTMKKKETKKKSEQRTNDKPKHENKEKKTEKVEKIERNKEVPRKTTPPKENVKEVAKENVKEVAKENGKENVKKETKVEQVKQRENETQEKRKEVDEKTIERNKEKVEETKEKLDKEDEKKAERIPETTEKKRKQKKRKTDNKSNVDDEIDKALKEIEDMDKQKQQKEQAKSKKDATESAIHKLEVPKEQQMTLKVVEDSVGESKVKMETKSKKKNKMESKESKEPKQPKETKEEDKTAQVHESKEKNVKSHVDTNDLEDVKKTKEPEENSNSAVESNVLILEKENAKLSQDRVTTKKQNAKSILKNKSRDQDKSNDQITSELQKTESEKNVTSSVNKEQIKEQEGKSKTNKIVVEENKEEEMSKTNGKLNTTAVEEKEKAEDKAKETKKEITVKEKPSQQEKEKRKEKEKKKSKEKQVSKAIKLNEQSLQLHEKESDFRENVHKSEEAKLPKEVKEEKANYCLKQLKLERTENSETTVNPGTTVNSETIVNPEVTENFETSDSTVRETKTTESNLEATVANCNAENLQKQEESKEKKKQKQKQDKEAEKADGTKGVADATDSLKGNQVGKAVIIEKTVTTVKTTVGSGTVEVRPPDATSTKTVEILENVPILRSVGSKVSDVISLRPETVEASLTTTYARVSADLIVNGEKKSSHETIPSKVPVDSTPKIVLSEIIEFDEPPLFGSIKDRRKGRGDQSEKIRVDEIGSVKKDETKVNEKLVDIAKVPAKKNEIETGGVEKSRLVADTIKSENKIDKISDEKFSKDVIDFSETSVKLDENKIEVMNVSKTLEASEKVIEIADVEGITKNIVDNISDKPSQIKENYRKNEISKGNVETSDITIDTENGEKKKVNNIIQEESSKNVSKTTQIISTATTELEETNVFQETAKNNKENITEDKKNIISDNSQLLELVKPYWLTYRDYTQAEANFYKNYKVVKVTEDLPMSSASSIPVARQESVIRIVQESVMKTPEATKEIFEKPLECKLEIVPKQEIKNSQEFSKTENQVEIESKCLSKKESKVPVLKIKNKISEVLEKPKEPQLQICSDKPEFIKSREEEKLEESIENMSQKELRICALVQDMPKYPILDFYKREAQWVEAKQKEIQKSVVTSFEQSICSEMLNEKMKNVDKKETGNTKEEQMKTEEKVEELKTDEQPIRLVADDSWMSILDDTVIIDDTEDWEEDLRELKKSTEIEKVEKKVPTEKKKTIEDVKSNEKSDQVDTIEEKGKQKPIVSTPSFQLLDTKDTKKNDKIEMELKEIEASITQTNVEEELSSLSENTDKIDKKVDEKLESVHLESSVDWLDFLDEEIPIDIDDFDDLTIKPEVKIKEQQQQEIAKDNQMKEENTLKKQINYESHEKVEEIPKSKETSAIVSCSSTEKQEQPKQEDEEEKNVKEKSKMDSKKPTKDTKNKEQTKSKSKSKKQSKSSKEEPKTETKEKVETTKNQMEQNDNQSNVKSWTSIVNTNNVNSKEKKLSEKDQINAQNEVETDTTTNVEEIKQTKEQTSSSQSSFKEPKHKKKIDSIELEKKRNPPVSKEIEIETITSEGPVENTRNNKTNMELIMIAEDVSIREAGKSYAEVTASSCRSSPVSHQEEIPLEKPKALKAEKPTEKPALPDQVDFEQKVEITKEVSEMPDISKDTSQDTKGSNWADEVEIEIPAQLSVAEETDTSKLNVIEKESISEIQETSWASVVAKKVSDSSESPSCLSSPSTTKRKEPLGEQKSSKTEHPQIQIFVEEISQAEPIENLVQVDEQGFMEFVNRKELRSRRSRSRSRNKFVEEKEKERHEVSKQIEEQENLQLTAKREQNVETEKQKTFENSKSSVAQLDKDKNQRNQEQKQKNRKTNEQEQIKQKDDSKSEDHKDENEQLLFIRHEKLKTNEKMMETQEKQMSDSKKEETKAEIKTGLRNETKYVNQTDKLPESKSKKNKSKKNKSTKVELKLAIEQNGHKEQKEVSEEEQKQILLPNEQKKVEIEQRTNVENTEQLQADIEISPTQKEEKEGNVKKSKNKSKNKKAKNLMQTPTVMEQTSEKEEGKSQQEEVEIVKTITKIDPKMTLLEFEEAVIEFREAKIDEKVDQDDKPKTKKGNKKKKKQGSKIEATDMNNCSESKEELKITKFVEEAIPDTKNTEANISKFENQVQVQIQNVEDQNILPKSTQQEEKREQPEPITEQGRQTLTPKTKDIEVDTSVEQIKETQKQKTVFDNSETIKIIDLPKEQRSQQNENPPPITQTKITDQKPVEIQKESISQELPENNNYPILSQASKKESPNKRPSDSASSKDESPVTELKTTIKKSHITKETRKLCEELANDAEFDFVDNAERDPTDGQTFLKNTDENCDEMQPKSKVQFYIADDVLVVNRDPEKEFKSALIQERTLNTVRTRFLTLDIAGFWPNKRPYHEAERDLFESLAIRSKERREVKEEKSDWKDRKDPDEEGDNGRGGPGGNFDGVRRSDCRTGPRTECLVSDLPGGICSWRDYSTYLSSENLENFTDPSVASPSSSISSPVQPSPTESCSMKIEPTSQSSEEESAASSMPSKLVLQSPAESARDLGRTMQRSMQLCGPLEQVERETDAIEEETLRIRRIKDTIEARLSILRLAISNVEATDLPRDSIESMLSAVLAMTMQLENHEEEIVRLYETLQEIPIEASQSLKNSLELLKSHVISLLAQTRQSQQLLTEASEVQQRRSNEIRAYKILLEETESWLLEVTNKMSDPHFSEENLQERLMDRAKQVSKLESLPEVRDLAKILKGALIDTVNRLQQKQQEMLDEEAVADDETTDRDDATIDEAPSISSSTEAAENVSLADVALQTGQSLLEEEPKKPQRLSKETSTNLIPSTCYVQSTSTQAEPENRQETIKVLKISEADQDVIEIATKNAITSKIDGESVGQEARGPLADDIVVAMKYQDGGGKKEEHLTSELNIQHVAPQSFETVLVEPDDVRTEVVVDADGTKRIIVRKLRRTVERHTRAPSSYATLLEDEPSSVQAFSEATMRNQYVTFTTTKPDGTVETITKQVYGGKIATGVPGAEINVEKFEMAPKVSHEISRGVLEDVALGPLDPESLEGARHQTTTSSVHAVVQQVTRRVIRKTRRIIRKVTIVDGKETMSEEIIEEPEEVEIDEQDIPHINISVLKNETEKFIKEEKEEKKRDEEKQIQEDKPSSAGELGATVCPDSPMQGPFFGPFAKDMTSIRQKPRDEKEETRKIQETKSQEVMRDLDQLVSSAEKDLSLEIPQEVPEEIPEEVLQVSSEGATISLMPDEDKFELKDICKSVDDAPVMSKTLPALVESGTVEVAKHLDDRFTVVHFERDYKTDICPLEQATSLKSTAEREINVEDTQTSTTANNKVTEFLFKEKEDLSKDEACKLDQSTALRKVEISLSIEKKDEDIEPTVYVNTQAERSDDKPYVIVREDVNISLPTDVEAYHVVHNKIVQTSPETLTKTSTKVEQQISHDDIKQEIIEKQPEEPTESISQISTSIAESMEINIPLSNSSKDETEEAQPDVLHPTFVVETTDSFSTLNDEEDSKGGYEPEERMSSLALDDDESGTKKRKKKKKRRQKPCAAAKVSSLEGSELPRSSVDETDFSQKLAPESKQEKLSETIENISSEKIAADTQTSIVEELLPTPSAFLTQKQEIQTKQIEQVETQMQTFPQATKHEECSVQTSPKEVAAMKDSFMQTFTPAGVATEEQAMQTSPIEEDSSKLIPEVVQPEIEDSQVQAVVEIDTVEIQTSPVADTPKAEIETQTLTKTSIETEQQTTPPAFEECQTSPVQLEMIEVNVQTSQLPSPEKIESSDADVQAELVEMKTLEVAETQTTPVESKQICVLESTETQTSPMKSEEPIIETQEMEIQVKSYQLGDLDTMETQTIPVESFLRRVETVDQEIQEKLIPSRSLETQTTPNESPRRAETDKEEIQMKTCQLTSSQKTIETQTSPRQETSEIQIQTITTEKSPREVEETKEFVTFEENTTQTSPRVETQFVEKTIDFEVQTSPEPQPIVTDEELQTVFPEQPQTVGSSVQVETTDLVPISETGVQIVCESLERSSQVSPDVELAKETTKAFLERETIESQRSSLAVPDERSTPEETLIEQQETITERSKLELANQDTAVKDEDTEESATLSFSDKTSMSDISLEIHVQATLELSNNETSAEVDSSANISQATAIVRDLDDASTSRTEKRQKRKRKHKTVEIRAPVIKERGDQDSIFGESVALQEHTLKISYSDVAKRNSREMEEPRKEEKVYQPTLKQISTDASLDFIVSESNGQISRVESDEPMDTTQEDIEIPKTDIKTYAEVTLESLKKQKSASSNLIEYEKEMQDTTLDMSEAPHKSKISQHQPFQRTIATKVISDRVKSLQNAVEVDHLGNVLHVARLEESTNAEVSPEERSSDVGKELSRLRSAIEDDDMVIVEETLLTVVENISTWLETIEYRILLNKESPIGPSHNDTRTILELREEVEHVEEKIGELDEIWKLVESNYPNEERAMFKECFDALEQHVKAVEKVTNRTEKTANKQLAKWDELLNGINNIFRLVEEQRKQLDNIIECEASTRWKLQELDQLENINRNHMCKTNELLAMSRDLLREYPGKIIPEETYLAHEITKIIENGICMERDRLLQLLALADEYEQTLQEFAQIIEIAENLLDNPISVTNLEHLQEEMQKHRKFFVNLNHCRAILESLEGNLDPETRAKHSDLHAELHDRASSLLDQAASRAQQMALAASRWILLEQGVKEERGWLQVAHQRVPDLQTVTSSDYDQYISLYQSLSADVATHHGRIIQLLDVASRLEELVNIENSEDRYGEVLDDIVKLQDNIESSLRRLLSFRENWNSQQTLTNRIENWMNIAEKELPLCDISPGNMRRFWELKAQYEIHNNMRTEADKCFEQALRIVPLSDEMLQRQFHVELQFRWKGVTEKIKDIQSEVIRNISSEDISSNERLKMLERELHDLRKTIDDFHGVLKTEEELDLYIERLSVLFDRVSLVQDELGRLGLLPAAESETVGILLSSAHRIESQIGEELDSAQLLRERLQALTRGLSRVRKAHQRHSRTLDQCVECEKQGSEAVSAAVDRCQSVADELSSVWQDLMGLRQLLHTLPSGMRITVSPVSIERDISALQDTHTELEARCARLLALLRNRLALWNRFERQLEMVQQSVQEADYMMELLTVQGSVDYDRLLKATERLEGLNGDLGAREVLIGELHAAAEPLRESCAAEVRERVEAAVNEAVQAWEDTRAELDALCTKYQHACNLWQRYRDSSAAVKSWVDTQMGSVANLPPEEAVKRVKVCEETLAEHKERLAELRGLVAQIASDVGLDAGGPLHCEVEALGRRLEDVRETLSTLADTADVRALNQELAHVDLCQTKNFLDTVQQSLTTVSQGEPNEHLKLLRNHLLALTKTEPQLQSIKDRGVVMTTVGPSVVEVLQLWQRVFRETFQQYHRLSARLVRSQDTIVALKLWQEYLTYVQEFLANGIPADYNGLSEHRNLCEVHRNLLTDQQNLILTVRGEEGRDLTVTEQFNALTNLHNETLAKIMERHTAVHDRLLAWDTYRRDQNKLFAWLKEVERERSRLQLRFIHMRTLDKILQRIEALLEKVPAGEAQAASLQEQQTVLLEGCDEALAVSVRMEHAANVERIANLRAGLETWRDFVERIKKLHEKHCEQSEKITTTFQEIGQSVNAIIHSIPGGSLLQSRENLVLLQRLRTHLADMNAELESLSVVTEQLRECLSPGDMKSLNQHVSLLWQQYGDTEHQLAMLEYKLVERCGLHERWSNRRSRLLTWLEDTENRAKSWDTVPSEEPEEVLKRFECELEAEMALKKNELEWVERTGQELLEITDDAEREEVRQDLNELKERWSRLLANGKLKANKLHNFMQTMDNLEKKLAELRSWVAGIEAQLCETFILENIDESCVNKKLEDHEILKKTIESESATIGEVLNLCELLLHDSDTWKAPFNTEVIKNGMENLEKRWKAACIKSVDRKKEITLVWKLLREMEKIRIEQEPWLDGTENALTTLEAEMVESSKKESKEVLEKVEAIVKDIEAHEPALKILEQNFGRLAKSRLEPENLKSLTTNCKKLMSRWQHLAPRANSIAAAIQREQMDYHQFILAHVAAVLGLTQIDVRLTQLQHLAGPTKQTPSSPRSRLQQLCEIEKELVAQNQVLQRADQLALKVMQESNKEDVAGVQELVDEYQQLWKQIKSRVFSLRNELEAQERSEVDEAVQVETLKFERDTAVQVNTLPRLVRMTSCDAYLMELRAALVECNNALDALDTAVAPEPTSGSGLNTAARTIAKLIGSCQSSMELVRHLHTLLVEDAKFSVETDIDEEVQAVISRHESLLTLARTREQQIRELSDNGRLTCPLCSRRNWAQLDNDLWRLEKWLEFAEGTQSEQHSPPSNIESLEYVIQEHRDFLLQLDSHKSIVVSLNIVGAHLADHTEDLSRADELRNRLSIANARWDKICIAAQKWKEKLRSALMSNYQFHRIIEELLAWLEKTEIDIRANEPIDLTEPTDVIETKYKKFRELRSDLERCEPRVLSLQESANQLLDEQEGAKARLQELRLRLQSLRRLTGIYSLKLGAALGLDPREIGLVATTSSLAALSHDLLDEAASGTAQPHATAATDGDNMSRLALRRGYRFFGRVLRISFPIQALMLLLIGAALLVPLTEEDYNCMLARSFTVTLHYPNGPPPV